MNPPNQTSSLRSNPPPILTLYEAAQLSGYLRKEHISRAVSNGMLPHVVYEGRRFVRPDDLQSWLDTIETATGRTQS
jgi:hypothetical protein